MGSNCIVYTDNNPLSYFKTLKLAANEFRWASELAQYDFDIRYRSGKENKNRIVLAECTARVIQKRFWQISHNLLL